MTLREALYQIVSAAYRDAVRSHGLVPRMWTLLGLAEVAPVDVAAARA